MVDQRCEVQREILLGGEPLQLCWAGQLLFVSSTGGIHCWQHDDACTAVAGSQQAADFACLAASPDSQLLAAGLSDGQASGFSLADG